MKFLQQTKFYLAILLSVGLLATQTPALAGNGEDPVKMTKAKKAKSFNSLTRRAISFTIIK